MVGRHKASSNPRSLHGGKSDTWNYPSEVRDRDGALSTTPVEKGWAASAGGAEVLGIHGLQEGAKPRHFGFLVLVVQLHAGLVEHRGQHEDGGSGAGGESDGVTRPRRDPDLLSPAVEHEVGEVDPVSKRCDEHVVCHGAEALHDGLEQIVGHWALRLDALEGEGDGGGFAGADED